MLLISRVDAVECESVLVVGRCRQAVHPEEVSVSVERDDFHSTPALLLRPGWTRYSTCDDYDVSET